MAQEMSDLFTREEAHQIYRRVCDLIHQRDALQKEVADLREVMGLFSDLRNLMHDDAPALSHATQNGHMPPPSGDTSLDDQAAPLVAHESPVRESQEQSQGASWCVDDEHQAQAPTAAGHDASPCMSTMGSSPMGESISENDYGQAAERAMREKRADPSPISTC
jgi:hypothetical protein